MKYLTLALALFAGAIFAAPANAQYRHPSVPHYHYHVPRPIYPYSVYPRYPQYQYQYHYQYRYVNPVYPYAYPYNNPYYNPYPGYYYQFQFRIR